MRIFEAKLEAAVGDGPWIEIAAGTFEPGAAAPLDIIGESYPGAVTDDFVEANMAPPDSGSWDTLCGSVKYRVSWS